jgi:hypothetical protein
VGHLWNQGNLLSSDDQRPERISICQSWKASKCINYEKVGSALSIHCYLFITLPNFTSQQVSNALSIASTADEDSESAHVECIFAFRRTLESGKGAQNNEIARGRRYVGPRNRATDDKQTNYVYRMVRRDFVQRD